MCYMQKGGRSERGGYATCIKGEDILFPEGVKGEGEGFAICKTIYLKNRVRYT